MQHTEITLTWLSLPEQTLNLDCVRFGSQYICFLSPGCGEDHVLQLAVKCEHSK